jgi:predicted GH43/DUF377 family glycosyl hydrolase
MRLAAAACLLTLSGCGRYADFTLPPLAGNSAEFQITFTPRPEPVFARGPWRDVLNPSVSSGRMIYSAWDGNRWVSGQASSRDGIAWLDQGVFLRPDAATWEGSYIAANGSAIGYFYWYEAGPRERLKIGLAREARAGWHKEAHAVLEPGPYGSWDELGVADPYVLQMGPYFYMYYLGEDRARRQRLGLARSPDGIHWQKLRTNPVLDLGPAGAFDEGFLGEPAVWSQRGFYWMLYTGRDAASMRRLGLARSTDGVHWTRLPFVIAGTQPWNSKVVCDPTVEVLDSTRAAVWFGGGDVPSPDENLNGQVGYGVLEIR